MTAPVEESYFDANMLLSLIAYQIPNRNPAAETAFFPPPPPVGSQ